jgi:predicted SprT family Zn-dependent metalloprotease
MNKEEAKRIARQKMDENGLQDWKINIETAYSRAGVCFHYEKEIRLSEQYIARMPEIEVLDTILHEIAHAILPTGHGHDEVWKATCIKIGCRPQRCIPEEFKIEKKWVAICPTCGTRFGRQKRVKRSDIRWCRKCHRKYPNDLTKSRLIFQPNIEYQREA